MTDAAYVIAPMAASPRQQPPAPADQSGDAASGDCAFSLALTRSEMPAKSNQAKNTSERAGKAQSATPSDASARSSDAATAKDDDAASIDDSQPAGQSKAEKADKAKAGKSERKAESKDKQQGDVTLPFASQANAAPAPDKAKAAIPGLIANAAKKNDGAAAIEHLDSAQSVGAVSVNQQLPNGIETGNSSAKNAASAAALKATAQAASPIKSGNGKPVDGTSTRQSAADATAVVDASKGGSALAISQSGSVNAKSGNSPKKDATKDTTAAKANALIGVATAGNSDSQPADKAEPGKAGDGNDGNKAAASAIAMATTASTKTLASDKLAVNAPGPGAPKPDTIGRQAIAPRAQDKPTNDQSHTADAAAALKAAAQAVQTQPAQQNAAQPAVPPLTDLQTQNPAFITAHILQTTAGANGAPTIQAQMDGPRLALPMEQVALQIHRHQSAGMDQFNIRLDPPDLGRIDVKIEMSSDGQTKAHLSADRQDTLNLLQRDSSYLERALNSNGLKTSLNFSLRQDGGASNGNGNWNGNGPSPGGFWHGSEEDIVESTPVRARIIDPTRIDILI